MNTETYVGFFTTVGEGDYEIVYNSKNHQTQQLKLVSGNSYRARAFYSDGRKGFETVNGVWNQATQKLEIGEVLESSKSDQSVSKKLSWGEGLKTVEMIDLSNASLRNVGTTAGMVAAAEDSRFGSVGFGDLTPATAKGTAILAALQDDAGVGLTAQSVSGNPVTAMRSLDKDRVTGYSDFSNTRAGFAGTDGGLCDLEPYTAFKASGGAVIQGAQLGSPYAQGLVLSTGAATNEYAAIRHNRYPIVFDPTKEMIDIATFGFTALPATEAFTAQMGFIVGAPALASQGMYLQLGSSDNKFYAVVKDGSGTESQDTGITAVAAQAYTRMIHYDPTSESMKMYIDGVLVQTILNSTKVVATGQLLNMAFSIRKSAGTNAAAMVLSHHYYNIQRTALANY